MFAVKLTSKLYHRSKSYDFVATGSYATLVLHVSAVAHSFGIISAPSKFSAQHIKQPLNMEEDREL